MRLVCLCVSGVMASAVDDMRPLCKLGRTHMAVILMHLRGSVVREIHARLRLIVQRLLLCKGQTEIQNRVATLLVTKNSRTFPFFQDPVVSQQCLNIETNSSY